MKLYISISFLLLTTSIYSTNQNDLTLPYTSQNKQDEFVLNSFFKKSDGTLVNDGFFIEFGAFDGKFYSNTYVFEQLGWKGLCIEPIPTAFEQLQNNRSCICINGCISNTEGIALFRQVCDGYEVLSGLAEKYDPQHVNLIENYYNASSTYYQVRCFKLSTIIQEYNIKKVDFLSIDTEGGEIEILKSLSKDELALIDVICIEDNQRGNQELINFMECNNFTLIKRIEQDVIFRNKKFMNRSSNS